MNVDIRYKGKHSPKGMIVCVEQVKADELVKSGEWEFLNVPVKEDKPKKGKVVL